MVEPLGLVGLSARTRSVVFCGKDDRPDEVDLASLLRGVAARFSEDGFRRVNLC
jgi:hypothetical protein